MYCAGTCVLCFSRYAPGPLSFSPTMVNVALALPVHL